ncbi:hypothetical protein H2200_002229 [Cladophialophora chaetospira]|uniref:Uncharacterized protein n=1 Tax=Cladophialophora chaetospira TaxID=386627 RepID=A0AA39CNB6_9EURO|nr:hypothetical protein H2200_002229 [Cladophialophora chaetospira]
MSEITLPNLKPQGQKIVLVTGAASGIGLATAQLFAQQGAKVILVDLSTSKLKAAADKIGHDCDFRACDVSSWEQQVSLFDWVVRTHGAPEVVCLNAGIDPEIETWISDTAKQQVDSNYLADDFEELDDPAGGQRQLKPPPKSILDVNYYGVLYGTKLAVHHFKTGTPGRIVVTGSAASHIAFPDHDMYNASKHALIGLVRSTSQRQSLKERNISISMVAPWLTRTGITANLSAELIARVAGEQEASQPEDVARGIAYLGTAEDANEVNGKCLWVRGQRYIEIEKAYTQWLGGMMAI